MNIRSEVHVISHMCTAWLVFILAQLFPLGVGKMLVFRGDKHIISSNTNTGWQQPRYKKGSLFVFMALRVWIKARGEHKGAAKLGGFCLQGEV